MPQPVQDQGGEAAEEGAGQHVAGEMHLQVEAGDAHCQPQHGCRRQDPGAL